MNKMPVPESLNELCCKQIAYSIEKAPPFYQEMIIGESRDRIKKNIIKEMQENLSSIIPEIIQDLVSSTIKADYISRDFRIELAHLPTEIVECAIKIATETVNILETKWLHGVLYQERKPSTPSESDLELERCSPTDLYVVTDTFF
jgi:hypothetical protein